MACLGCPCPLPGLAFLQALSPFEAETHLFDRSSDSAAVDVGALLDLSLAFAEMGSLLARADVAALAPVLRVSLWFAHLQCKDVHLPGEAAALLLNATTANPTWRSAALRNVGLTPATLSKARFFLDVARSLARSDQDRRCEPLQVGGLSSTSVAGAASPPAIRLLCPSRCRSLVDAELQGRLNKQA